MHKCMLFVGILYFGFGADLHGMRHGLLNQRDYEQYKYTVDTPEEKTITYVDALKHGIPTIEGVGSLCYSLKVLPLLKAASSNTYYMSSLFYSGLPIKRVDKTSSPHTGLIYVLNTVAKDGFILNHKEYKGQSQCEAIGDYLKAIIMPPSVHKNVVYDIPSIKSSMNSFLLCLKILKKQNLVFNVPRPVIKKRIFEPFIESFVEDRIEEKNISRFAEIVDQVTEEKENIRKSLSEEQLNSKNTFSSALNFLDNDFKIWEEKKENLPEIASGFVKEKIFSTKNQK